MEKLIALTLQIVIIGEEIMQNHRAVHVVGRCGVIFTASQLRGGDAFFFYCFSDTSEIRRFISHSCLHNEYEAAARGNKLRGLCPVIKNTCMQL